MIGTVLASRPRPHPAGLLRHAVVGAYLAALCQGGCGSKPEGFPAMAPVTGTVTMDGNPLQKVLVTFLADKGVVTSGATDASGCYTLLYRGTHRGAGIGRNTVQVTTLPDDPSMGLAKEPIPAVYNSQSTLTAEVVAGANTFDFALESKPPGKRP